MSVKTVDFIAPNTRFEHEGSVEVLGNVGAGAVVAIKEGGLLVKGDVEVGAQIETKGASSGGISISSNGGSISIGNVSGMSIVGGKVIINGVDMTSSFNNKSGASSDNQNLIIEGLTGNGVTLKSSNSIDIKDAGDNLKAKAGHNVSVGDVGHSAKVKAGHSLTMGDAGAESSLDADHSISVGNVGERSKIDAGHSLNAGYIGQNSKVESGHNANIQGVDRDCEVEAGHSLSVREAHKTAELEAGHKKTVSRTVDTLSFTFTAKAPVKTTSQQPVVADAGLNQAIHVKKVQLQRPTNK